MPIDKIGKFQVLDTLGSGANSNIIHIRRDADSKEYALKMVPIEEEEDKKYLDQANHEFRIAQMLNHPNVLKIYALETEKDWLRRPKKIKLLLEYVNGQTLDKGRLLNMAKMLRVFEKAAAGLVHMHKQGVIHADLKPNNIMLGKNLNVKVIDFGLSWVKGEPKSRLQGTPEYMAPETGQHKMVNERTDIYNFGATMYRIVTMKLPPSTLPQADGYQIPEKEFEEALRPVKDINRGAPDGLCDLIHRCLSYNAMKRPERMSEVQGILDQLADDASGGMDIEDA